MKYISHFQSLVEKFQTNDSCRCAVLSITAANAGITLTAAQLVIFAELHWNPGVSAIFVYQSKWIYPNYFALFNIRFFSHLSLTSMFLLSHIGPTF